MGPGNANLLQAHLLNAGFVDEDLNKSLYIFDKNIYTKEALTEAQLNELYNAADVNISTTLGEGCGLSLLESMASGTTSIAPNNSALPEVLGDTGYLIPNKALINIAMDNGHMRPVVDIEKFIHAIEVEYQKWVVNGRHKVINEAGIARVETMFQWEDKRQQLMEVFKSLC
jgi:glycosyltransferase involved in cell wall biosynthesis